MIDFLEWVELRGCGCSVIRRVVIRGNGIPVLIRFTGTLRHARCRALLEEVVRVVIRMINTIR